jgi:endonuclease YncB( thermonuclease family)
MAAALLLLVLSVGVVSSAPVTSDEVRVIDGDTIRLHHQKPNVRLVGSRGLVGLAG